jgi:hypothetical protein
MNISANGFEWLAAPIMVFTRTDRLIFLTNWISFLMMPGLVFSVFTKLKVRPRAAFWWMWILPAGWCYAMQASSVANDSFSAVYALAAVDLALRSFERKSIMDLWVSLLAVGLLTGTKQTSVPLALLWVAAAWPNIRLFLKRKLATVLIAMLALLVSILPTILFNTLNTGTWTGLPANFGFEYDYWSHCQNEPPFWAVIGNLFAIPAQNMAPPCFPWCMAWNAAMARFLQTPFGSHFANFESFGRLNFSVGEDDAGIGLAVTLLTLVSAGIVCLRKFSASSAAYENSRHAKLLRYLPYLALLIFMAKVTTFFNARHLAPYYIFLFPALLHHAGHVKLTREKWWQIFALTAMFLTVLMLIFSRVRPLFPVELGLSRLKREHPQSHIVSKAYDAYSYRFWIQDQRDKLEENLPPGRLIVGYLTFTGGMEPGLWLPFGNRRVERIFPDSSPQQMRSRGISYVLIDDRGLRLSGVSLADWLQKYDGFLVYQSDFKQLDQPENFFWSS